MEGDQEQKPPLAILTPLLAAVIRRGVGAATRAGAARFVSALAARAPREALASPEVAAPLLTALWSGAKAERGVGVRKAYVNAAAALVSVSPPKAVTGYVDGIVKAMSSSGGGGGDGGESSSNPRTRELAGMASLGLFRSSGGGETFTAHASARVLPLAAVARRDPDEAAAAPWQALWDDAAPGGAAAARLFGDDVLKSVVAGLAAGQYSSKIAAAEAAADLAKSATGDAALLAKLAPALSDALAAQIPGRWFEGKDKLVAALGAVVASSASLFSAARGGGESAPRPPSLPAFVASAASVLAAAAKRPKASFSGASLLALAAAAPALPRGCGAAGEGFAAAAEGLALAVAPKKVAAGDEAEVDPDARRPPPPDAAASALEALAPALTDKELEEHGGAAAAAIAAALSPAVSWVTRVATAKAGAALARRGGGGGGGGVVFEAPPPVSFPSWMESVVEGLASASAEGKVSAVRSAAADALGAVAALALSASPSSPPVAPGASKRALEVLDAMASGDSSDAVKARALAARSKATAMQLG